MEIQPLSIALIIILLPLLGALIAGLLGKKIGRRATHLTCVSLVGVSFLLATYLFKVFVIDAAPAVEGIIYTWVRTGAYQFDVALLLDQLSITVTFIVTFVSFMVHIYTIGYMADDPGYQRFFSYVSLFTFAMLILVLANNFLLMFFGWEGVGLVSYLLIGFWFQREAAIFGGLKAFLVNRIADGGFIIGMAVMLKYFGHMDFTYIFAHVKDILDQNAMLFFNHVPVPVVSLTCILLFVGAMGKSAQVPLHVWLPESMEGPTPISALIHAATMVTAGIYMVARASPLFEYSTITLTFILTIGAITCLFMGILAVFHHDIKRVIAYSTLSQLGYMTVALGASAYNAAIFHLITHAFFKALLFLAAGSVIIALHHEQDMRKMGGLKNKLPVTYLTFLIGAIALAALPPFSGFYSKDAIIEALGLCTIPGAKFAYICAMLGAFITPLYIFRALFLTFHGPSRMAPEVEKHVKESPWVVLIPLIALAVPSIFAGGMLIGPMLFKNPNLLANSIFILPEHDVLKTMAADYHGAKVMALEAGGHLTFWLSIAGIFTAWCFNMRYTAFAERLKQRFAFAYKVIVSKYGFDDFNQIVFVRGTRMLGNIFYHISDQLLIDGIFVNGSGQLIRWFSRVARHLQSGYIYHYTFAMIAGVVVFLGWLLLGS